MKRYALPAGVLVLAIAGVVIEGCRLPSRPINVALRPTGGAVHGSVFYSAPLKGPGGTIPQVIMLPDIEVFLRNISNGTDSSPVITDLYGRYLFPRQKPGTYQLRWNAQRGWAAGQHPDQIVISSQPRFPLPSEIRADRTNGVVFGQIKLADGVTPWSYDELFGVNHTATVTLLNLTRSSTLAGPVHANAAGYYAAAGLTRGQDCTIRVQSQAATVTRVVPAASISLGNPITPTDVQLPNKRPELVSVFASLAGTVIQTAAPSETIVLTAVSRDLNGDPLTHDWKALPGNGVLTPSAAGDSAQWTLPAVPGRHTAYVQVHDGRGGYDRKEIEFVTGRTDAIFSGRAIDKITGAALPGAEVVASGRTTVTDGNGFFRVKTPLSNRYVLTISRQGYATFSRVVDSDATGQTWRMVRAQSEAVDPTQPITLVDKRPELERQNIRGSRITVPANALISATGTEPPGPLTAYLATLNIADAEAPGDWGAVDGGKEVNLISYGATFIEFRDGTGAKYNLRPGIEAGVEMFAASSMISGAPAQAKLWAYDESDGYWKQSGISDFVVASGSFVGKVSHFSTINTDLEKDQAACLKVMIYPPIPTGVKLRVTNPGGTAFTQVFEFVLDAGINAVYRLPANTDVRLELFNANGTPYTGSIVLEEKPGEPLVGNVVNTGAPIPSGENLFPPEPYTSCKLVILREAEAPTANSFLAFKGAGSAALADGYYKFVDPDENGDGQGERETLGAWWSKNGFTFGPDGVPNNAVRTSYLNHNDLGSGRDMYFKQNADGTVAAFVTNYGLFNQDHGNADLAATRDTPGATVCMEYSSVAGQGSTRIVKFFVFAGGDGGNSAPRQLGADLDKFGVKFVPNLCLNCHGGSYNPAIPGNPTFAEVNMGASFRELDIETYKFPGGRLTANTAEKAAFKAQNLIVKGAAASDTIAIQPIKDLIANWYPGASADQDNTWTPPGWVGAPQQGLYHDLVKKSCRTCHVALDGDNTPGGIGWITYDQLKIRHGEFLKNFALCKNRFMPHAVTTYRNFWLSSSPHSPAALRNFSNGPDWTPLGPCQ